MVAVGKGQFNMEVHSAEHGTISKVLGKSCSQIPLSLPWIPATPSGGDNTSVALKCK